jgi:asparagine synthetase B (glutamine-hydrolysing)
MPLEYHQAALDQLAHRGPDFIKHCWVNETTFIAQSVLHVTGLDNFYYKSRLDAFAYNGEIYDFRDHGDYTNDVELAYHAAKSNPAIFKNFNGTWAWIYADSNLITFASDPQGEKSLYYYQDDNLLIVCSDVAPILTYINAALQPVPYKNKCWTMITQTPWKNIRRCEPGKLYRNGRCAETLDSIWDWITSPIQRTLEGATEEFAYLWNKACTLTRPQESATLSYSGGIDSSLILKYIPDLYPLAIDIIGKDNIVDQLNCDKISVDAKQWALEYQELIAKTQMPAQTWSYVGKWLLVKNSPNRIVFTGLGADELFGGYDQYLDIKYSATKSVSTYSTDDHENLWNRCLDVYQGHAQQATLLMDYWYQVVGVDAPGLDRLGGYWGKETRNPFLLKFVMKFALNLPWHLKVKTYSKPVLKSLFRTHFPDRDIQTKKGFAGHANDSLPWLGVDIDPSGDRYQDWKQIAQNTFYAYNQTH